MASIIWINIDATAHMVSSIFVIDAEKVINQWKINKICIKGTAQIEKYRQISNISCTKSQNAACLIFQLSLSNPLKPGIKLRM